MQLSRSEINHLRRLLGWMRCSEGVAQSPEQQVAVYKDLAAHGVIPSADNETRERLMQSYNLAADVPKYIRAALKQLTEVIREHDKRMSNAAVMDQELTRRLEDHSRILRSPKD